MQIGDLTQEDDFYVDATGTLGAFISDFISGGGFSATETDPIFTKSPAFGITNQNISDWATAYLQSHVHANATALNLVTGVNTGDQTISGIGGVAANSLITGATKTKITYDSKGLVVSGANATTADIDDSTNRRYITDSQLASIANLSGINTGDASGHSNLVPYYGAADNLNMGTNSIISSKLYGGLLSSSNLTIQTTSSPGSSVTSINMVVTGSAGLVIPITISANSSSGVGSVGINNSTPVWPLDVIGNIVSFRGNSANLYSLFLADTSHDSSIVFGTYVNTTTWTNDWLFTRVSTNKDLVLYDSATSRMTFSTSGGIGIDSITSPTARFHIAGSTIAANTAPIKISAGTLMSTPEAGAIEYDGTSLYITDASNSRKTIAFTTGSTSYVPYSGATTNLNMGTHSVVSESILFNTSPSITPTVGQLFWNSSDGTLSVNLDTTNGVTLDLGHEQFVRAVNKTGSQINDGQVVYINGAQGNRPTITLARANSLLTARLIGVATQNIANNQEGCITVSGVVHGYDTRAFSAGTYLYLSPTTAGALTSTIPVSPYWVCQVGVALNSTVNGSILVVTRSAIGADYSFGSASTIAPQTGSAVKKYVDDQIHALRVSPLYYSSSSILTNGSDSANSYLIGIGVSTFDTQTSCNSSVAIGFGTSSNSSSLINSVSLGTYSSVQMQGSYDCIVMGTFSGYLAQNISGSNFIGSNTGYNTSSASYCNLFGNNVGKNYGLGSIGQNNIIIGTDITLPPLTIDSINIGGVIFGTGTNPNGSTSFSSGTEFGKLGICIVSPTARLELPAGTIDAGMSPLKIQSGLLLSNPESGAIEYDGSHFYVTLSDFSRRQIDPYIGTESYVPIWNSVGALVDSTINVDPFGNVGISYNTPDSLLHIGSGTELVAPLKINTGVLLTTPQPGSLETDGTHIYWTDDLGNRKQLDN